MAEHSHSIDLRVAEKLQNENYRRRFFWAETSAEIASQLIALRKRRNMSQKEVAEAVGTKQPAISRAERADYQNWNLQTLRAITEALDARLQVIITPAEDVLTEYETQTEALQLSAAAPTSAAQGHAYAQGFLEKLLEPPARATMVRYVDPQSAAGPREAMWTMWSAGRRQAPFATLGVAGSVARVAEPIQPSYWPLKTNAPSPTSSAARIKIGGENLPTDVAQ